jgi:anti-sigma factor RsiW
VSRARHLLIAMERRTPGMISCGEFEDFIDAYLEGRLSWSERLRFRTHVLVCPACRRYLRRYQRSLELGRRVCRHPDDALPADVPDDLVAAILAARQDDARDRGAG